MSSRGPSFQVLSPLAAPEIGLARARPRLLGGGSNSTETAAPFTKYVKFNENIVFVGFGSIGQGTLPLVLRHFDVRVSQVTIITADDRGQDIAEHYGVKFIINPLTRDNYVQVLTPYLTKGSFVVNLSVDVSSLALMELCQTCEAFYIDTCTEPWAGEYADPSLSASERSNYALREDVVNMKEQFRGGTTSVVTHGANPGLVSHFVKQALLNIAKDTAFPLESEPQTRDEWAKLALDLGIKVIHVAERDTQMAAYDFAKRPGEFVNTWSVDGFISEGCYQPAEMGWGTHEKHFPADGHVHKLDKAKGREPASIYLDAVGGCVKVRTWTPDAGSFIGFAVTHAESISISDFLSVKDEFGNVMYRPTVHYAYHPTDYAVMSLHEMQGNDFVEQKVKRVLKADEIVSGMDELGVLLMGHEKGAYWYGSQLSIDEARKLAPFQNATALQVTGPIVGAMVWAIENPKAGIVEPDEIDFKRVLEIAHPYLGNVVGRYSDWSPIKNRSAFAQGPVDKCDPWQFVNFRVF